MAETTLAVEVAYALPEKQKIIAIEVEPGCTAYEAAVRSRIVESFPDIDLENTRMGIFGKAIAEPRKHVLSAGDRVELYRPLLIDPKQARKARAEKANMND